MVSAAGTDGVAVSAIDCAPRDYKRDRVCRHIGDLERVKLIT
jgi:hypothetical protein